ncbi:Chromate resistance protein ChrB [Aminobacter sp. AP02]|uniref:Chromate resistance protein ChrB n=1 Tax=Aminobacter sp. AP02 TaxID=2135737 RepID=UPI001FDF79BC|nr:Chromate resistance protein ChrB [Aminobacter sp. AP02]
MTSTETVGALRFWAISTAWFLGRCDDFEAEIAKEIAINKFTYAELEEEDTDRKKLQGWLDKIKKLDFYGAALAQAARRC